MLSDECIADQVPFDIPENWTWVRLGSVINIVSARRVHKSDWKTAGIPFYRAREIVKLSNREHITDSLFISKDLYDKLKQNGIPQPGDLMVTGVGTIGATYIIKADDLFYYKDASVLCFENRFGISSEYLRILMQTPFMLSQVRQASSGTTVATITIKNAVGFIASIPPLAEQRRIVERVGELMPLVEEYGKFEDAREELDVALPDRLRKSVLQMAVQGKLVSQNPDDEPASALLERIREQRRELIKQKKMKAPKGGESVIFRGSDGRRYEKRIDAKGRESEPACIEDEIPFEIPESWEWTRLESVTTYIQRGKSPKYSSVEKYPVVAQKCNQWSGFSLEKAKFIDPETIEKYGGERILKDGDLLWNSTGLGTLGRMAIYDSSKNRYGWAVADSHVTVIRTRNDWLDYRFVFAYFAGPSVQSVIEDRASGSTKQKELAQETVKNYLVPVAPLTEQRRIVAQLEAVIPRLTNQ